MKVCIFFLICILGTVMCANDISHNRDKRFLVKDIKKAIDKVVDTTKKVVDKTKDALDKLKKTYNKAKDKFKKAVKGVDWGKAVDTLTGLIDSSFTQSMCEQTCEGGASVIFKTLKLGALEDAASEGCGPLCEGGLSKIEQAAQG